MATTQAGKAPSKTAATSNRATTQEGKAPSKTAATSSRATTQAGKAPSKTAATSSRATTQAGNVLAIEGAVPMKELSAAQGKKTSAGSTPSKARSIRSAANKLVLGIDIGGSGIKGAPVDLHEGRLAADRLRIETPQPATPEACAVIVNQIVTHFATMTASSGPVGCTYPGVVWDGITHTAANMDSAWIKLDADGLLEEACKRPFTVINDAQAAVLAEVRCGAARGAEGLVLMLTFGTGIGSGMAYRGVAIPGVEFGHLRIHGADAERYAAASVRDRENLSYKKWAERVNEYLVRVESMIWPELIVLGGGVVSDGEKWIPRLRTRTPIVAAALGNDAGIVGAAIAATSQTNRKR